MKRIAAKLEFEKKTVLIFITLIVILFLGCSSANKHDDLSAISNIKLESTDQPVRIFYDGTGEYLIKSYMYAHPEVNIELTKCIPSIYAGIDIRDIFSKYGVPDLIIASEETSGYLSEWYHEGYIADISEFCSYDESINTENYFPETFEVFSKEGYLCALPLGISIDFMLTSESKYFDSAFSKLKDEYTGRELVSILLEEVHKDKEQGEFFSEFNRSLLNFIYCLDGFTQKEDGIYMDEELFKQVYEFVYKNKLLQDEARSYWNEQGKMFNGSTGYASPCALDPRRYEGKFKVDIGTLQDAPAIVLSYAETAFQYHTEEGIKAIYIPMLEDGSKYKARVKVWGAITEESKQKELAYELLRALMDEELNYFGMLRGVSPEDNNVYPINRANALSLLERFESHTTTLMYENDIKVDRIDVSAEEKAKHDKVLMNISGLYCITEELMEVSDIFNLYFDANISDYKNCYLDMLNTLNSGEIGEYGINLVNGSNEEENYEVEKKEGDQIMEMKENVRNTEIGETFFMGGTEQDNNLDNGVESIEWIVLEKTEAEAFVISQKILEWIPFSKYEDRVEEGFEGGIINDFTWSVDKNQQHEWLLNELYKKGFSDCEKEIIIQTHNITTDSALIGAWELESDDYLYIPSQEEVEKYMIEDSKRCAEGTEYVTEKAKKDNGGYISWTLRTEGPSSRYTRQITENGEFGAMYTNVPNGVRPVMWLDIS